jgi:hypothetical protein
MTRDKSGKLKDTGVRFSDIAGMPWLVTEMQEVVQLLLRDPCYMKLGARCPRVRLSARCVCAHHMHVPVACLSGRNLRGVCCAALLPARIKGCISHIPTTWPCG